LGKVHMAQFSMKVIRLNGAVPNNNQQSQFTSFTWTFWLQWIDLGSGWAARSAASTTSSLRRLTVHRPAPAVAEARIRHQHA
jgi:hypothetical protein